MRGARADGDAFGNTTLFDPGDPVDDFAGCGTGCNQPPAAALAFQVPGERPFQPLQLRARRLHGGTALLFLNFENLQQAPHGARDRHYSNLRGQGSKTLEALGKANPFACRLRQKGAYGVVHA